VPGAIARQWRWKRMIMEYPIPRFAGSVAPALAGAVSLVAGAALTL
jgi:hypothetical protein